MKRIKKLNLCKMILQFFLVIIVFILFSCVRNKADENHISIRFKWIFNSSFSDHFVAKDMGFFSEQKIQAKLNPGGFELDPIKLVVSGSDDFGITGADNLIIARSKGMPLVAIGVVYQKSPVVFITKKGSGVISPRQFVGKKVGVKIGTDVETVYHALLRKLNIDASSIKEVPIKFEISPFLEDVIDVLPGYITDEPLRAKEKGFAINVIDPSKYGIEMYGMVYFTTESLIKSKPDLVEKYLRAVLKGWDWIIDNRTETAKIVVKYNENLTEEGQIKMLDAMVPLLSPQGIKIGSMERDKWIKTQEVLLETGIIKEKIDIDKVYTTQFVDKILGHSGN